MVTTAQPSQRAGAKQSKSAFKRWLLEGSVKEIEGPFERKKELHRHHPWYKVMCLTGVDYFSTLGYQPGIAFIAAGTLAPVATIILVLLTLLGALPIYRRVAEESPHGEGSISMLAALMSWWKGKLFILILLGFVATDFIITITLSAADATAHVVENSVMHDLLHGFRATPVNVGITVALITFLSAVFIKGFKEAIGIAVVLVVVYLLLNLIVVCVGLYHVAQHPSVISNWQKALLNHPRVGGNWTMIIFIGLLVFPKLALGLSGLAKLLGRDQESCDEAAGDEHDTHNQRSDDEHSFRVAYASARLVTCPLEKRRAGPSPIWRTSPSVASSAALTTSAQY